MHKTFDLVLVGCGLVGASLAAALRDSPLAIALVESQPPPRSFVPPSSANAWDSRVYAISPANFAFLAEIGLWSRLATERMNRVRFMEVWERERGHMAFAARDADLAELAWIIEAALMRNELRERLKQQANVTLFSPVNPVALSLNDPDGLATLSLQDGQQLRARLIVGADGRNSWTRQQAGLPAQEIPYHAKAVVANFTTEKPHRDTAWQWFREDGILAWLPLPGERISMVWSAENAKAKELLALSPDELATTVAAAGGNILGHLTALMPAAAFPLCMIRVPAIVAPRVALIGDAAHGVHPLTGNGINLGFQDARVLADLLRHAAPGQDIGEPAFLRNYQCSRRKEIQVMQHATDFLAHLFTTRLPGLSALRAFGLDMIHRLPALKKLLARYASGMM